MYICVCEGKMGERKRDRDRETKTKRDTEREREHRFVHNELK